VNLVILDGMSGSGKSTLRSALIKAMNFDVMTIDRFSPSIWVYDTLRGVDRTDEIIAFEEKFDYTFYPIFAFCHCEPSVAEERDKLKEAVYAYEEEHKMFIRYMNNICKYTFKAVLNTGQLDIAACVKLVQGKINERNSLHLRH